jgi:serine-type D-Ala-D-Ala carboxypeptidase
MQQAVADAVFPGGVLLVSRGGRVLFHGAYGYANLVAKRPMTTATVFDLASLTKPLATALAVMLLVQQGGLGLEQDLAALLPGFARGDKAAVTISQLLSHSSGLPAYRPYYLELCDLPPAERRPRLRQLLAQEPLVYPPGERSLYSDLGFMLLEWIVETVSGRRLDRFVAEAVYGPLGIAPLFFIGLEHPPPQADYAATEQCPWRRRLIESQVHDENAYVLGGIAGHAGLFGTAAAVHGLLAELVSAYHGPGPAGLFQGSAVRRFFQRAPGTDKALGFDLPSATGPSCGRFFPPGSVGHLGFTGTSFWIHPEQAISVILLTNRVHPSRDNIAIRRFRPLIHDAVMQTLTGGFPSGAAA